MSFIFLFFGIPLGLLFGSGYVIRQWRSHDMLVPTLLAMVLTCWFASAASCRFEYGENNRLRYELDPAFFVLVVFTLWTCYKRLRLTR